MTHSILRCKRDRGRALWVGNVVHAFAPLYIVTIAEYKEITELIHLGDQLFISTRVIKAINYLSTQN